MPLYALDAQNRILAANEALLNKIYLCPGCKKPLRKRIGKLRQAHFYHLQAAPHCHLYSKSIDHLILQSALLKKIPSLQAEKPFPKLLRIADLCWEEQKLIFEIQCSPISTLEVASRNRDYAKEGYEVIWLLDDRLFNKKRLKIAEAPLRTRTCFFFSLKKEKIYDQFEVISESIRLLKGPQLEVDLTRPLPYTRSNAVLPNQLQAREGTRYFIGDLIARSRNSPNYLKKLIELEIAMLKKQKKEKSLLFAIKRLLCTAFEYLLSRACQ